MRWWFRAVWVCAVALCCALEAAPVADGRSYTRELAKLTPQLQGELEGLVRAFQQAAAYEPPPIAKDKLAMLPTMLAELWKISDVDERRKVLRERHFRLLLPEATRTAYEKTLDDARKRSDIQFPPEAAQAIRALQALGDDVEAALAARLAGAMPSIAELQEIAMTASRHFAVRTARLAQARLVLGAPDEVLRLMAIDRKRWKERLRPLLEPGEEMIAAVRRNAMGVKADLADARLPIEQLAKLDGALEELIAEAGRWFEARKLAAPGQVVAAALSTVERFPEVPASGGAGIRLRFKIAPPTRHEPTTTAAISLVQRIAGEADQLSTAVKEALPLELEIPTGVVLTHVVLAPSKPGQPPTLQLTKTSLVTTVRVDHAIATDVLRQLGIPTLFSASVTGVELTADHSTLTFRFAYSVPGVDHPLPGTIAIRPGNVSLESLRAQALADIRAGFEQAFKERAVELAAKLGVKRIDNLRLDPRWADDTVEGLVTIHPLGIDESLEVRFRVVAAHGRPRFEFVSTTVPVSVRSRLQGDATRWLRARLDEVKRQLPLADADVQRLLSYVTVSELRFDAATLRVEGTIGFTASAEIDWMPRVSFVVGPTQLDVTFDAKLLKERLIAKIPATLIRLSGVNSQLASYVKGKKLRTFGFELEVISDATGSGGKFVFDVIARKIDDTTRPPLSAQLEHFIFDPATNKLDLSQVKPTSPAAFTALIKRALPLDKLPESAVQIGAPRFSSSALVFELSLHVKELSIELPLGEITVTADRLAFALPPDLPGKISKELAKRLPALSLNFGRFGKLDEIQIESVKLVDPIEVWVQGKAKLGDLFQSTVHVRVAPSFEIKFDQKPEQLLGQILRGVGFEFIKEKSPVSCPGLALLKDEIGIVCPMMQIKLPLAGDVGGDASAFTLTLENTRVTTHGVQAPETIGVAFGIIAIPLPFDFWLVNPRFSFNRIRKELAVAADITFGTPEVAGIVKLTVQMTAPAIPLRFTVDGSLIVGAGFIAPGLTITQSRGFIDFREAEARLTSETVGPFAKLLDLKQDLHLSGKERRIMGMASVRVLGLDLADAKLLIDARDASLSFSAEANIPLLGRHEVRVSASIRNPLEMRASVTSGFNVGPFEIATATLTLTTMYVRLEFQVLGVPFVIQVPHLWALTPDYVLSVILSIFDFDLESIMNFFKHPSIGPGGKRGRGSDASGSPDGGDARKGTKGERQVDGGSGGTSGGGGSGSGGGNAKPWNPSWGAIGFEPMRDDPKSAAVIRSSDRKLLGVTLRDPIEKKGQQWDVRLVDRFRYWPNGCMPWRVWSTDGREGSYELCEFLVLLGPDNHFYLLSFSLEWKLGILEIPAPAENVIGSLGRDLYTSFATVKLGVLERLRLRIAAKRAIEGELIPRDVVSWGDTAETDGSGFPMYAGSRSIYPATKRTAYERLVFLGAASRRAYAIDMTSGLFTDWAQGKPDSPALANLYRLFVNAKSIGVLSYESSGPRRLLAVARIGEEDALWLIDDKAVKRVGLLRGARFREDVAFIRGGASRRRGEVAPFLLPYWDHKARIEAPPRTVSDDDPDVAVELVAKVDHEPSPWWAFVITHLANGAPKMHVYLSAPGATSPEGRMLIWSDRVTFIVERATGGIGAYPIERKQLDRNFARARGTGHGWLRALPVDDMGGPNDEKRERQQTTLMFLPGDEWGAYGTAHPLGLFVRIEPSRVTP